MGAEKHKDIACTVDPTSVVPVEILEIPMGTCKTFEVDVAGNIVTGSYIFEGSCEKEEEDEEDEEDDEEGANETGAGGTSSAVSVTSVLAMMTVMLSSLF